MSRNITSPVAENAAPPKRRRAIVLLIVITLLALFAAVAIGFVYYANSEQNNSLGNMQAASPQKAADMDRELLMAYILQQLIYGGGQQTLPSGMTGDANVFSPTTPNGLYSSMYGQSLAENMMGYNAFIRPSNGGLYVGNNPSTSPYIGVGKIGSGAPFVMFPGTAYAKTVNNTDIVNLAYCLADRVIFDPERLWTTWSNLRSDPSQSPAGTYVGWNVPYSYPDMNNLFLTAINGDGEILAPSFWRTSSAFGSMDPANPNWNGMEPYWKYLTMRPHPSVHPFFPRTQSGGGDVRNYDSGPGLVVPYAVVNFTVVGGSISFGSVALGGTGGTGYPPNATFNLNVLSGGGNAIIQVSTNASGSVTSVLPNPIVAGSGYTNGVNTNVATGPKRYYAQDSIWIDFNLPILTGPDGRKFKPMVAPLIASLDGKINPNVHGNVKGINANGQPCGASAYGFSAWEINPGQIISASEYPNLFLPFNTLTGIYGGYVPGIPGQSVKSGTLSTFATTSGPYYQSYLTLTGAQAGTGLLGEKFLLPGETFNGRINTDSNFWPFPLVSPKTYASPGPGAGSTLVNHPALYNPFYPQYAGSRNWRFPASDTEDHQRYGGTGTSSLTSTLFWLAPNSFGHPSGRSRRLFSTVGNNDVAVAAPMPWLQRPLSGYNGYGFPPTGGSPKAYPWGQDQNFPTNLTNPLSGEFSSSSVTYNTSLLQRININRPLTPYPAPDPTSGQITDLTTFHKAEHDRKLLCQDIFNLFLQVTTGSTSVPPQSDPVAYKAAQWLAQLAVNIVDFRDGDNYITRFNWNGNKGDPNGWVYGTELPRLVLNEVYAEVVNDPLDPGLTAKTPMATLPYQVNLWAELHNPMKADPAIVDVLNPGVLGAERLQMPTIGFSQGYPIYKLTTATGPAAFDDRQLGKPASTTTEVSDWGPTLQTVLPAYLPNTAANPVALYSGPSGPLNGNQGFYVVGPQTDFANPINPSLSTPSMTYTVPVNNAPPTNNTFYLSRLACPDMPPQPDPTQSNYNPYVTIDYVSNPQTFDGRLVDQNGNKPTNFTAIAARSSIGKKQVYAGAASQWVAQTPQPPNTLTPQHTFFRHNAVEAFGPPLVTPVGGVQQTLTIPFNSIVHTDRQMTSPLEMLHVSAYAPYQLTQLFMAAPAPYQPAFGHMSMPAWLDTTARIYRSLEFIDAGIRPTAIDQFGTPTSTPIDIYGNLIPLSGRIAGKIDLCNVWDIEVFRALVDQQPALSSFSRADVDNAFYRMIASRTPSGLPGPNDRPFRGLAAGSIPLNDPILNNVNNPINIGDTLLRPIGATTADPGQLVFGVNPALNLGTAATTNNPTYLSTPPNIPFTKTELMNKIFNNVTSRSNVFGVWLTVGFFDVTDGPVTQVVAPANAGDTQVTIANIGGSILGVPWAIAGGPQPGTTCIWVDNEPMYVTGAVANGANWTVSFLNPLQSAHGVGATVSLKGILGAEVGASEGRQTRHRMFAVIDRTALSIPSNLTNTNLVIPAPPVPTAGMTVLPSGLTTLSTTSIAPGAYNATTSINLGGVAPYTGGLDLTTFNAGGTGLVAANITTDLTAGTVTVNFSPKAGGTVSFILKMTDSNGTPFTQSFTFVIYQPFEVDVPQIQGVASLNYPAQTGTPPKGPSLNVNYSWMFQFGLQLGIIDPNNKSSETISVLAVNQTRPNTITAYFFNPPGYAPGATLVLPGQPGAVPNSILGHPGPQNRFDHRQNSALVPHYSIIE